MTKSTITRLVLAGVLLAALAVYAAAPKEVFHSFNYGSYGENQGIEVLDYQYGSSKIPGLAAEKERVAMGHIGQGGNVAGAFPVGDSLYVKWRVLSTGKVYEDKVDLKSRLPSDMGHKTIHFAIKGPPLYVYLISNQGHAHGGSDCPVLEYRDYGMNSLRVLGPPPFEDVSYSARPPSPLVILLPPLPLRRLIRTLGLDPDRPQAARQRLCPLHSRIRAPVLAVSLR